MIASDGTALPGSLVLDGVLRPADVPQLRHVLARRLSAFSIVVLDVAGLRLQARVDLRFLSDALVRAGGWPAAALVVVGPDQRLRSALRTSGVDRDVVLCDDPKRLDTHLGTKPERVVHRSHLACHRRSVTRAVAVVGSLGHRWQAGGLIDDAQQVTRTLVTHAVVRARTRSALQVSLDHEGMRIAVRDFANPDVPTPRHDLDAVRFRASSCGVVPRSDGHLTWAVVTCGENRERTFRMGSTSV